MSFDYNKTKSNETDGFWTSYSDLFLGLSTIFLLLYVTASLRAGTNGAHEQIENQKLKLQVEDLRNQLKMYDSTRDEHLKQASEDEQQNYEELMDKLSLLQEQAKDEKHKLLKEANENGKKERALNQYQQLVRNMINSNALGKTKVVNRDNIIGEQDTEISGLETDVKNKQKQIADNENRIAQAQQQLQQEQAHLKQALLKKKLTKMAYEKQLKTLKQRSAAQVQSLQEKEAVYQAQLQAENAKINDLSGELNEKTEKLGQVSHKLGQVAKVLDKTKNELGQTKEALGQTESELGQTKSVLNEKDQELGQTKNQLGQVKNVLGQKDAELGQAKAVLGQKDAELGQTKAVLGQKDAELGQTKSLLGRIKSALGQKDAELGQVKGALGQKDAELGQIKGALGQKDAELGQVKGALGQKDAELGKVKGALGQKDAELGQVRGALGQKDAELGQVKGMLGQKDAELGQVRGALGQKDAELGQVKNALGQTQSRLGQTQSEVNSVRGELAKAKAERDLRKDLAGQIKKALAAAGVKAEVNGTTGEVTLDFGDAYFESDSAKLKEKMKAVLEKAMPAYARSLFGNPKMASKITDVEIVGFASPTYQGRYVDPESASSQDKEALKYNMDLSYRRAKSIFNYIVDEKTMEFDHQKDMYPVMKVSGRSFLEVIKVKRDIATTGQDFCKVNDCKKAQRVLIRFGVDPNK